jgi:hypothetical protein
MAAGVTSQFEKMGESPLTAPGSVVNVSGNRSPYTMEVPRKGPSGDSESEPASVRGNGGMMSGEHNGPRFSPLTTVFYPNSPEMSQTGRGMRTVPSKGDNSFWGEQGSNQSGQSY